MSYVAQALVFQEFEAAPAAVADNQRACVIGPRKALLRYGVAAEKEGGRLGEYDSLATAAHAWPNRAAGDVVIDASTRLFIENALLQYFHNPAGTGDTVRATKNSSALQALILGGATGANVVRASSLNWVTSGAYTRNAGIPTDVQVGDGVKVSAVVSGEPVSLTTRVTGFLPDIVASTVGSATEDATNLSARAEDVSSSAPGVVVTALTPVNNIDIVGDVAAGNHVYEQGVGSDSYVLEVIDGGEYDTAVLRLTSASGTDNVAEFSFDGALGDTETVGAKGISLVFDQSSSSSGSTLFTTGQRWSLDVVFPVGDTDVAAGGTYTGVADTTYVVTVSKGASFADGVPQITVSTTTGIDFSGPHEVAASGASVAIGTRGVTATFTGAGLAAGDRFYVPVTASVAGPVRSLVLADSLPTELTELVTGTPRALSVTLYIRKNMEIDRARVGYAPLTNFDTSATQITVNSGILGYDARVPSSTGLYPLPVRGGTLFVEYAAYVAAGVGAVGSVTSVGALSTAAAVSASLGVVTPLNPLAYGVYSALTNVSGGQVLYIQTAGDTVADYLAALDVLSQRDDVYSLVPMTFDRAVQDAVVAHVTNMSGAETGRWRIAWVCRPAIETAAIVADVAGAPVLATIADDPAATGTQYTRVAITTAGVHLIDSGVRAGDILRAQYTADGFGGTTYASFVVDAVLSPAELRLFAGPSAPVSVAAKVEIWRSYTRSEVAAATGQDAGTFGTRRAVCVWPDYVDVAGELVPGYFLAAALAGLKSSVLPQQSLTNVEVVGFDGATRTTRMFSSAQLDTMAASGMLIVTQSALGQIYVRKALTTDNSDINHSELMRTTNLDSISYVLLARLAGFQGKYNITPKLIELVRLAMVEGVEGLSRTTASDSIGPQILGLRAAITVEQHPLHRDRILIRALPDLPYPNNNSELYLVV